MNNYYHQGSRARREGHGKDANPYASLSTASAWWLAGWNDQDIEGVA